MELFLIYVVTRLTDLKATLFLVSLSAGLLVMFLVITRTFYAFSTPNSAKTEVVGPGMSREAYWFSSVNRVSKKGLCLFTPVFVIVFCVNMFLPTTRDAVVIAGGYGLVEAVKTERAQRLFPKSTKVATLWLDEQLNGEQVAPKSGAPAQTK